MERVWDVRQALREIPGSLRDYDDRDWAYEGEVEVLQTEAYANGAQSRSILPFDEEDLAAAADPHVVVEFAPDVDADLTTPLIGEEASREIEARVRLKGIDALGWYVTFHQTSHQWGIYISLSGVGFLAERAFGATGLPLYKRIELSLRAILRHELVHFAADYMAAQWELAVTQPCYWPAQTLKDPAIGYNLLEEQLANGYMLRGFRYPSAASRGAGIYRGLRDFVRRMPAGYCDAEELIRASKYMAAVQTLGAQYAGTIDGLTKPPRPGFDYSSLYPAMRQIDARHCPIMLVHDGRVHRIPSIAIRLINSVPEIKESIGFRKSLTSMGPQVRDAWEKTKSKLAYSAQIRSLDFKKWGHAGNMFSVRVDRSIRAHLILDAQNGAWTAHEIGQHKAMGHG